MQFSHSMRAAVFQSSRACIDKFTFLLQIFILLWTGHSPNSISRYSSNHVMPRKMQTWALNLLSSSPFNSPAITLSRSCGAVGGGLRWKKTFKLFFLLIWNLLLGQLLLGGLPLLDAVGDVDGDRLGAKVPAADVARDRHLQPLHWHLGQLWLEVVSFPTSLWQAGECDLWSAVVVGILDQLARSVLYPGTIVTTATCRLHRPSELETRGGLSEPEEMVI